MCRVLHPNVRSVSEMKEALEMTYQFYIDKYPQARFEGKTSGQIRKEAISGMIRQYPIKQNNRIKQFWAKIENKKSQNA